MAWDLTLGDAVRIATAGLLALFGIILATRRSVSRAAIPLGIGLACLAVSIACSNVALADRAPDTLLRALEIAGNATAIVAIGGFALVSAPALRRRTTLALVLSLAAGAIGGALTIAGGVVDLGSAMRRSLAPDAMEGASQIGFACALAVLGATAWSLSSRDHPIPANARGPLAAGLVVYPLTFAGTDNDTTLILWGALVAAIPVLLAVHQWARERAARRWWPVMVFVPLVALTVDGAIARDVGVLGIVRVVAVALLAHAVFREDAFGVASRPVRDRRAAILTTFLAVLLIVAQVAQNFLSTQYGLIMGGIVAGALLLAAKPIERALERPPAAYGQASTPSEVGDAHRVYREAVRRALHDREVTREEEIHLAELAREMRLDPAAALRIRHEVEDER